MRHLLFIFGLLSACISDYDLGKDLPPEDTQYSDTAFTIDVPEDTDIPDTDEETIGDSPVAVCSVDPVEVTPPFETATFYGRDSYDPAGMNIVTWDWSLVTQPNGSASFLAATSPWEREVTPDLAGQYIARLIVETSDGRRSDPVDCSVDAVPGDNLWIEMYWVHNGDDMDLHLIRPNGNERTNGDCYYANCTTAFGGSGLEWGNAGGADNPALDIDDIPGTGPENINIAEPSLSGIYRVMVHDYPGSVYQPANDVTVNIYIGGVLMWNDTRTISGEDSDNDYAGVNWPQRTVTSL